MDPKALQQEIANKITVNVFGRLLISHLEKSCSGLRFFQALCQQL
jgi:hypothetical protein